MSHLSVRKATEYASDLTFKGNFFSKNDHIIPKLHIEKRRLYAKFQICKTFILLRKVVEQSVPQHCHLSFPPTSGMS